MANLPPSVIDAALVKSFVEECLLRGQGKVRDIYEHPYEPDRLAVVATDRISIFDFVLPSLVARKGEVLTALTHFWLTQTLTGTVHHLAQELVNDGVLDGVERNDAYNLTADFPDIQLGRTLVVYKLEIMPYELIFRAHIGGSVWKQYEETGKVAGVALPSGLTKWQQLAEPLFTPSTKAENGHDVNITQERFFDETGEVGRRMVEIASSAYQRAYQHALRRGIVILDTKFEMSDDTLADEVLTPDSSRFTTTADLVDALAKKREPVFYDKQPVREWGMQVETPFYDSAGKRIIGLKQLDPANEEHAAFVHSCPVPPEIIQQCTERYLDIFRRLTGWKLGDYQERHLL